VRYAPDLVWGIERFELDAWHLMAIMPDAPSRR
jgi:hypothetical protein